MNLSPASKKTASALAHARTVLETESAALRQLADTLDERFEKAVAVMKEVKGRVAVTGIGKSGHVARKIAATLASTGTPAFFIHPSEASHGDLGMVTQDDCVLALSNSGEAHELGDILAYARRFSIPLIAITSRKDSMLGNSVDITLELPPAKEACPLGLAPTTSTTLMMALGDALAVAIMEARGFSEGDYKVFHPGGKLGRKLMLVKDLMHTGDSVPLAAPSAPMGDVLLTMTQKTFGCCGIVEKGDVLAGIITDGDLRRHMQDNLLNLTAQQVMTRGPKTIGPQALAAEALGRMNEKKVTTLFVVADNGKVEGIVRMHDLLKAGVG
jgi:arabinose-5-phosphate isomerase